MDALNCTYDDYQKAAGFSGLDNLVKERPRLGKFFKIENGGMRLPSIRSRILANPSIAALAHTHPLFKGINASSLNRDGEHFGPADWIPLIAFQCPTYLYTPRRRTYVMEYNGKFIVVRNLAGGEKKWHVSH